MGAHSSAIGENSRICCDWQNNIMDAIKDKQGLDMLTIACLMYCTGSEDPKGMVEKCVQARSDVGTDNPAVVIPAVVLGKEVIVGGGSLRPIWEVPLFLPEQESSNSGSGKGDVVKVRPEAPRLDKAGINSWLYGDAMYVEKLAKQAKSIGGDINMFLRVANMHVVLEPLLTASPYDDGDE